MPRVNGIAKKDIEKVGYTVEKTGKVPSEHIEQMIKWYNVDEREEFLKLWVDLPWEHNQCTMFLAIDYDQQKYDKNKDFYDQAFVMYGFDIYDYLGSYYISIRFNKPLPVKSVKACDYGKLGVWLLKWFKTELCSQ